MKRTIIILLLFASALAYGQAGYLDKTFGDGGVTISRQGNDGEYAFDVVVLPNDNILQIGCTLPTSLEYELVVTHLTKDGHLDIAFGNNGRCIYPTLRGSAVDMSKVQLYPDGRVLIFGFLTIPNLAQPFIARILANGDLDSSFGVNGIYHGSDSLLTQEFVSLTIREDGSIIALGFIRDDSNYKPSITMLTDKGKRNTSFGMDGRVSITIPYNLAIVKDAYIDKDGKCVFGASPMNASFFDVWIIRTDLNGKLDQSFGNSGIATASLSDNNDVLISIKELRNGKKLCLTSTRVGLIPNIKLVQFTSNGMIDTSFGDWGSTEVKGQNSDCFAYDFILDQNDKIVIAGAVYDSDQRLSPAIFRFQSDGSLDASFGTAGIENISNVLSGDIRAIDIQSDGKYIATGYTFDYASGYSSNMACRIKNTVNEIYKNYILNGLSISLHPTPSTDNCTVTYTLPASGECTMTLSDESGRDVRTFATNQYLTAGEHEEELDLRGLAAGVYFLQIETGDAIQSAKLIKQ